MTGYEAFDWDAIADSETHDEIVHLPGEAGVDLTDLTVNFANTFSALTPESDPYCTGSYAAPTAPAGRVCRYLDKDSQAGHVNGFALPILKDSGFDGSMTASLGSNDVSMSWAYTAP